MLIEIYAKFFAKKIRVNQPDELYHKNGNQNITRYNL